MSEKFTTGYMDNAVFDLADVLDTAEAILEDKEFDTLVGTGFSGGLIIPALALRLGKKFVLVRKESDDSHHGSGRLLGELGEKWIFVDDFVSTGRTRNYVIEKIADVAEGRAHETTHVGDYFYAKYMEAKDRFQPAEWI